ncbi:Pimeloyl-ACP methyl ester carboxylesterase [Marivirga sericea]|uniref:Pimeloyl-ACP methyl ester carboxylesterase n=1 Tax=Marivirga sericea TaxID=1028 RepID=A0A1X7ID34_9BACT|nr:alpha/beta hydrolase [Marivirga sericea]SMG12216.1 Pimeloyl-ACP methyl ester carboxylesterase [Marivirga sericea]
MRKTSLSAVSHLNNSAKEWVIFIHGAGGSTATWKYQIDAFKDSYNLLLLDLRDHGNSKNIEPAAKDYDFDLITSDIKQVLDQYKIDKAHFITLSFGSVIMQDISIKYPQLVASAVFAGGIFKANYLIKIFVQLARFFNYFLPYKWMYSIFSYLLMPFGKHQQSRRVYKKQARKLTSAEYMRWVGLYKEFFRLLNRFYNQNINFPALAVMGDSDFIFLKSAKSFTEKHKSVSFTEIRNAGHICNIDQAESFNEVALFFAQKHSYHFKEVPAFQAHNNNNG